jgi:hypothetical protein
MSDHKLTPSEDIAAAKIHMQKPQIAILPVTDRERNEALPKPLVKVVNNKTGDVVQASLEQLNEQMRDFHRVILLIEDEPSASTVCATVLHEMWI